MRPGSETFHNEGLDTLHAALEGYRRDFEAGDKSAALWALRLSLKQNLPPPYWCADAVLAALEEMENANVDLHAAFKLDRLYPRGKRGGNVRRNEQDAKRLWMAAWMHHVEHPGASKEECIKAARAELRMTRISLSTARALFNDFDARQARYRRAHGMKEWMPFPDLHALGKRRKRT